MLRRSILAAAIAAFMPLTVFASADKPVAGTDYVALKTPVQTSNPKKIEVLTFFAYTCPHCYTYEKSVEPWAAQLPNDVV